jgi:hypothetical protein
MSRILVATKVVKLDQWFGDPVGWEEFCRIVRDWFSKDIVVASSRGTETTIDNYSIVRTNYHKGKDAIWWANAPLTLTRSRLYENSKLIDGDSAVIETYGFAGYWTNGQWHMSSPEQEAHFMQRLRGIDDTVGTKLEDGRSYSLEVTIDRRLSLVDDKPFLPNPEEDFYVSGSDIFIKGYLELLPPHVGWKRTLLDE